MEAPQQSILPDGEGEEAKKAADDDDDDEENVCLISGDGFGVPAARTEPSRETDSTKKN